MPSSPTFLSLQFSCEKEGREAWGELVYTSNIKGLVYSVYLSKFTLTNMGGGGGGRGASVYQGLYIYQLYAGS